MKSFLKTVGLVLVVAIIALLAIRYFSSDAPLDFNYGGVG